MHHSRSHSHGDVGRFDEWAPRYERHWMQRVVFDPIQSTLLNLASEQLPQPFDRATSPPRDEQERSDCNGLDRDDEEGDVHGSSMACGVHARSD